MADTFTEELSFGPWSVGILTPDVAPAYRTLAPHGGGGGVRFLALMFSDGTPLQFSDGSYLEFSA